VHAEELTEDQVMSDDPIVAEVRIRRDEVLRKAGGTVDALVRFLKDHEAKAGREPVRLEPKVVSSDRAG
jgi:hypothetical protein